jgi:hypothetical protein
MVQYIISSLELPVAVLSSSVNEHCCPLQLICKLCTLRYTYHLFVQMKLLFKTLHAFQGDPSASQLSFEPGEMLRVDDPAKANVNGWAMGRNIDHWRGRSYGWFPLTYVVSLPHEGYLPNQNLHRKTHSSVEENDSDFGFDSDAMGGSWTNSGATLPYGENAGPAYVSTSSSVRSAEESKPKFGSKISQFSSKAKMTASNTASKAVAATSSSFREIGHRWNDMRDQHDAKLDQKSQAQYYQSSNEVNPNPQQYQERSIVAGNGFLPGRATTTERSVVHSGNATTTTVSTTEKATGGFMPWIPGKKTVTTTATVDSSGNQTRETTESKKGGFYIIPLGPVGLVACGAIAAKNAYDNHELKKEKSQP